MKHSFKIILFLLLFFVNKSWSQSAQLNNAIQLYQSNNYNRAILAFEEFLKSDNLSKEEIYQAKKMLAESYFLNNETSKSELIYAELLRNYGSKASELNLKYAQSLASNGKFKEADKVLESYQRFNEIKEESKLIPFTYNPECNKIERLSINTDESEFSPAYFKNGIVLLRQTNRDYLDFKFYSFDQLNNPNYLGRKSNTEKVGNDQFTPASALDSKTLGNFPSNHVVVDYGKTLEKNINSNLNEGPAVFSKDGQKMYFTRNYSKDGFVRTNNEDVSKIMIYEASWSGSEWIDVKELPFNSPEFSTGHPALSKDGNTLIFSSDRPGGYGKADLYMSTFQAGNWSAPINLGSRINSTGDEMFPFLDDNDQLYFSSDSYSGFGGKDIYFAQMNNLEPTDEIVNLQTPINSEFDDFGLITDKYRSNGYFSSNRYSDGKNDDIYRFQNSCLSSQSCQIIISITDSETNSPIQGVSLVAIKKTSEESLNGISDGYGNIIFNLDNNSENLEITAAHLNYKVQKLDYKIENCENGTSRLSINLNKNTEKESKVILNGVSEYDKN